MSEPNGFFRSDNLLSNEIWLQWVIPDLLTRAQPGGVYLGVGPEQNFTYIAALKPKMVFITDIRRGNLHMHLMYKALFELSADRADFVSRLFTKKRPAGLTDEVDRRARSCNAFWDVADEPRSRSTRQNLKAIQDHLTKNARAAARAGRSATASRHVYCNFYWYGPAHHLQLVDRTAAAGGGNMANYGDLMMATDGAGVSRSYLASEETFQVLKDLAGAEPVRAGRRQLRRAEGAARRRQVPHASTARPSRRSICRTSSSTCTRTASGATSAPTSRRCRSTTQSTFIRSAQGGGGGRRRRPRELPRLDA